MSFCLALKRKKETITTKFSSHQLFIYLEKFEKCAEVTRTRIGGEFNFCVGHVTLKNARARSAAHTMRRYWSWGLKTNVLVVDLENYEPSIPYIRNTKKKNWEARSLLLEEKCKKNGP